LLPNYRGVIIDEAHKFSNALSQMQTFELNLTDTKRIIEKLKSQDPEQTKLINIAAFQLSFIAKRLATLPKDEVIAFDLQTKHLIKQLYGALHDLNQTVDQSDLRDAEQALEHITAHEERIFWLTEGTIHSVSKYPGRLIKHVVYDKTLPVILTSGTLSIDGDFHYFKRELGLQSVSAFKLKTIQEHSPYNLKEQCHIYISEATLPPEPNNPVYLQSIASEIIKLINHTNGRTLVLFTSYKSMRQIYDLIVGKTDYPLIMASRGARNAIEHFKKTANAVLLSTGAWEGVDIQGEQLSSVIIVKLPFLVPDIISEEKRKQYKDHKAYRDAVLIPNMLIKLRQGIGRLIRHEDDKGLISILDSRAGISGAYRVHVNNILPACETIYELGFDGLSCKNDNTNAAAIG
jgi:ATP-dependent DNA helicase DinG